MQTEYGGYLPLELPVTGEYFDAYGADVLRLDCGRNALRVAVEDAGAKKVYLPIYTCDTVYDAVQKTGAEIIPYHIGENLMPVDLTPEPDAWLVYTNYFGVVEPALLGKLRAACPHIIFDNTQAFFAPPLMGEEYYNVYSCRKFLGVSDGAYLIHRGIGEKNYTFEPSVSWPHATQLLKSIECGTNGAYAENKENENSLGAAGPRAMSALSRRILQSVDYRAVAVKRQSNFVSLHNLLKNNNALHFWESSSTPMCYPFYCEQPGLREKLVANKVYIPQLWSWVLDRSKEGSVENRLSRYLLPLPIDQRYNLEDMLRLARLVKQLAGITEHQDL